MELTPINKLFDIKYGNSFELINLVQCEKDELNAINFVSRTEKNNGISAFVKRIDEIEPNKANTITVAVSGSVLATFLQPQPYYTGFHVLILTPKKEMGKIELLFYTMCIRENKYKYNYGRQANRTLKNILIPVEMPADFRNISLNKILIPSSQRLLDKNIELNLTNWRYFPLTNLFKISSTCDELPSKLAEGSLTPYITSSELNNGITMYVDEESDFGANTITANRGGSVGCFFFQPMNYMATPVDVRILTPRFSINPFNAMFLITILQMEKYRFNYSRKMGTGRLKNLSILLPAKNGKPDFEFMENYIKSLPYSSSI